VRVVRFEQTPNPNAVKCILSERVSEDSRSFRTRASAQEHPLAAALFSVEGVQGVLLRDDWMTVNKSAETPWKGLKRAIRSCVESHA